MGEICSRDSQEAQFSSTFFEYAFDEDNKELRITHDDHIQCSSPDVEKNLKDCETRLKQSQKLFKDNSMKTDAIILKSLNGQETQIKCTFERPYVFLNDSTATRGKSYKIVNKLDSKASQIVVRDEALQYFGVFLCYLADNPRLVTEILLTGANTYGIHCLKMNVNSNQHSVYIDDYILCLDRLPMFVQPIKGQYMWPCLFEKAWLKVNGNIHRTILKIDPQQAFHAFLSYPMRTYLLRDGYDNEDINAYNTSLLRNTLYNLPSHKGCVITTKKSPKHKIGISGRKNFYLIKCFNHQGKQLYYFRNPCAKGLDFRGNKSEMSKPLIDHLMTITKDERIPEGNFVLEQDEMLEQVESFLIIHYEPNSPIISQLSLNLTQEKETFVEFELPRDGCVSLCFHQDLPDSEEDQYSPLSFLVVSINQSRIVSDQQNLEGCFGVNNTYLLQNLYTDLKAGRYLIRLKKKRKSIKTKSIGVSNDKLVITAPLGVNFSRDQSSSKNRFDEFLKQHGRSKLSDSLYRKFALKQEFSHISYWVGDLAVVYLRNIAKSKQEIKVQAGFSELKNLKCTSDELHEGYAVIDHISDEYVVIFEKIDLAEETRLGRYVIQSF